MKSTGILPVGEYDLLVQATDPYYTSDNFELDINVQNNPPVLLKDKDGLNISYNAKISYPVSSVFKNLDKDALIFTAKMKSGDALPSWLNLSQSTGWLNSTGKLPLGEYDVMFQVNDTYYNTSDNFELDINVQNTPPVVLKNKDSLNVSHNGAISYPISSAFNDPDNDTLTFAAKMKSGGDLPSWLTFSQSTGLLKSTGVLPLGEYDMLFQANDPYSASDNFELDINVQNHPPVAIKSNVTVNFPVNETFTYDIKSLFTDSDGDKLTYLANLASGSQSFPSWLTFSENDGKFSGVPIELGNYTQSNPK